VNATNISSLKSSVGCNGKVVPIIHEHHGLVMKGAVLCGVSAVDFARMNELSGKDVKRS
jgi:hypothetical protein